jgi:hypothetical protein
MWITVIILTMNFVAGLIYWLEEFRASNSQANNYLPLTGKPLSSRQAHG